MAAFERLWLPCGRFWLQCFWGFWRPAATFGHHWQLFLFIAVVLLPTIWPSIWPPLQNFYPLLSTLILRHFTIASSSSTGVHSSTTSTPVRRQLHTAFVQCYIHFSAASAPTASTPKLGPHQCCVHSIFQSSSAFIPGYIHSSTTSMVLAEFGPK